MYNKISLHLKKYDKLVHKLCYTELLQKHFLMWEKWPIHTYIVWKKEQSKNKERVYDSSKHQQTPVTMSVVLKVCFMLSYTKKLKKQ